MCIQPVYRDQHSANSAVAQVWSDSLDSLHGGYIPWTQTFLVTIALRSHSCLYVYSRYGYKVITHFSKSSSLVVIWGQCHSLSVWCLNAAGRWLKTAVQFPPPAECSGCSVFLVWGARSACGGVSPRSGCVLAESWYPAFWIGHSSQVICQSAPYLGVKWSQFALFFRFLFSFSFLSVLLLSFLVLYKLPWLNRSSVWVLCLWVQKPVGSPGSLHKWDWLEILSALFWMFIIRRCHCNFALHVLFESRLSEFYMQSHWCHKTGIVLLPCYRDVDVYAEVGAGGRLVCIYLERTWIYGLGSLVFSRHHIKSKTIIQLQRRTEIR